MPFDLRKLFLKALACTFELALLGVEAASNGACVLLDLLELLDLGNEV
ncbi:Uncharacterised protein [Acinetobacter baumannii]|nr:Uncharacterised protein [Acinetobacter baumannii]